MGLCLDEPMGGAGKVCVCICVTGPQFNSWQLKLLLMLFFYEFWGKATIQHLFPFCLVALGPVVLPRGDVIHTDESGGQLVPGNQNCKPGKSKGLG